MRSLLRSLFPKQDLIIDRVAFWVFLGPILLTVSLCIAGFKSLPWDTLFCMLFGYPLCLKWKKWGFLTAAIFLSASVVWNYSRIDFLWSLGCISSVVIGWIISRLCILEVATFFDSHKREIKAYEERVSDLNAQLKAAQLFALQEKNKVEKEQETRLESYRQLVEAAQFETERQKEDNKKLFQKSREFGKKAAVMQMALENAYVEIDRFKSSSPKLLNQLNDARVNNFQLSLLHDAQLEKNKTWDNELKTLRAQVEYLSEHLRSVTARELLGEGKSLGNAHSIKPPELAKQYELLKSQFAEKSEVLHQTRREFFQVESKLLALERECEHNALDSNPNEVLFLHHLGEMEAECKDLEVQLDCLQDLITELLTKKKTSRPRRSKAKVALQEIELPLIVI